MTLLRMVPAAHALRARCLSLSLSLALVTSVAVVAPAMAAGPPARPRVPHRSAVFDVAQRIDVNQISMAVTNSGSIAWDKFITGGAGFEFPKGSGKTAVFAAGPWIGARVDGAPRVVVSEYSDEYGPGPGSSGLPADPNLPQHRVYKLSRVYGRSSERDSALADYRAGAVPYGAPDVEVRPDGSLSILGDQMLWAVFNDLDPAHHTNNAGSTAPLGLEVRQTVYAFDRPDALGRTVFVRYQVVNVGESLLQDVRFGMWGDPDVGDAGDDLAGCDSTRGLGYAYNATDSDAVYGSNPPAVGFDLLRAVSPSGQTIPANAFIRYINGTDPTSSSQTYNYLHGLDAAGNPIIDPVTGAPTRYMHSGDPVAGTGWRDSIPGDRRLLLATGPFDLLPRDTFETTVAIVVAQGADRLASIAALRADDDFVQAVFDGAPPPTCAVTVDFDFKPNTLKLRSMGRWVSGHIKPPPPYTPADIDVGSILLNGAVPVDPAAPVSIGEGSLKVKFDRLAVQRTLAAGAGVPVTVTGDIGSECFTGGDVVRSLRPAVTAPQAGEWVALGLPRAIRWETPPEAAPQWAAVLTSTDDGQSWNLVADHLPNDGTYAWHVPFTSTPVARVAVVLVEAERADGEVEGLVGIGERFVTGTPAGVEPANGFALHGATPQPARGSLRVSFRLPDGAPATLQLYDPAGRRVWSRDVGGLGPGVHSVLAGTAALPAGIYLVRLAREGRALHARAVVMR